MSAPGTRVVALSGGVGGARVAYGLSRILEPGALTVVVNTGDDFDHWGLRVCPDLDTVMYTLSEQSDDERGWGLLGDTFQTLAGVAAAGGDAWFQIGDRDLVTHLARSGALAHGETLTAITERLCAAAKVPARVLPMTDGDCRTKIDTKLHGTLTFQDWLVRHRAPKVRRVYFDGRPPASPAVLEAIDSADLVIIGPSNPYVSIDPILSLARVRDALKGRTIVAVSPIVHGKAVKGPLAEMFPALGGVAPSPDAVARHYGELLSGLVIEEGDACRETRVHTLATATVMKTRAERVQLARKVLDFALGLRSRQ